MRRTRYDGFALSRRPLASLVLTQVYHE